MEPRTVVTFYGQYSANKARKGNRKSDQEVGGDGERGGNLEFIKKVFKGGT